MGVTDSDNRLMVALVAGATDIPIDVGWSTTSSTFTVVVTTDFDPTRDRAELFFKRNTSSLTVASEEEWSLAYNVIVRAQLKNASGADITAAASYTGNTVKASEVIVDMLGRILIQYDGANATVATTSYAIEQLAYPDGITPGGIVDDLLVFEPGMRWGAYESNSVGKYRFEFVAWPTTVRYDVTADTGIDIPGSSDELFNRVLVRYRDPKGAILTTTRTQAVAILDAESLIRQAFLDLGDEVGTLTNAQRAGDQFLAEHAGTPNRGRMTISSPLHDLDQGRRVDPFDIKAGTLIRVRGALPRIDALNASTRDGATVFRIAAKDYDAMTGTATLELESYSRSAARTVAAVRAAAEYQKRRR
jgi:hypothetical protein